MVRYSGNALSRIVIADLKFLSRLDRPRHTSRVSANSEIAFSLTEFLHAWLVDLEEGRE